MATLLLREKKLPHSPRSAIGTTGTGVRRMICCHAALERWFISPVAVILPSGKMQTRSLVLERGGHGVVGALEHPRVLVRRRDRESPWPCRKNHDSSGTLKIR